LDHMLYIYCPVGSRLLECVCGFRHISTSSLGVGASHALFITIFGRPLQVIVHPRYRTILMFVLSVFLVYCCQTVRWIRMPLGIEVGLSPGEIVLGSVHNCNCYAAAIQLRCCWDNHATPCDCDCDNTLSVNQDVI